MITIQELFDDLAYGEFSNMAIGNSLANGVTPDKYPKVLSHINLGLLDLYTRFDLKKKEIHIHQQIGRSLYYLRAEHVGDPAAGDAEIYIDGTGDNPPASDIIKFLKAWDGDGVEVPIDSADDPTGVFMVEPDVVKMEVGDTPKIISMQYQASYPRIIIETGFNPKEYKLYFPSFLKVALLAYIASRLFVGKEAQAIEGEARVSNTFQYRYEAECAKIARLGLSLSVLEEHNKFDNNGWV